MPAPIAIVPTNKRIISNIKFIWKLEANSQSKYKTTPPMIPFAHLLELFDHNPMVSAIIIPIIRKKTVSDSNNS